MLLLVLSAHVNQPQYKSISVVLCVLGEVNLETLKLGENVPESQQQTGRALNRKLCLDLTW